MKNPIRTLARACVVALPVAFFAACGNSQTPTPSGADAPVRGGETAAAPAATPTPEPTPARPPDPTPEPLGDIGDPKHADCWVVLAGKANEMDRIQGPIRLPVLRNLPGSSNDDWTGNIGELEAGPTARVTVFEGESYSGTSRGAQPGKKLSFPADLATGPGSMVIEFVAPSP